MSGRKWQQCTWLARRPTGSLSQHRSGVGYSARSRARGREVMFFSEHMVVPKLVPPLREVSGAGTSLAAAQEGMR